MEQNALTVEDAAARWGQFFESLSIDALADLGRYCDPKVRFKDPFNDVTGVEPLRRIFVHMFETTVGPKFTILDTAVSGQTAYIRWCFDFTPRGRNVPWRIDGMSEVTFNAEGLVLSHIDHWDAGEQFYARLPIVGALIRYVQRKLAV